jgi:outer membrane protein assembly factor BamB
LGAWSLALLVGSVNAACGGYRPEPDFTPPTLSMPVPVVNTPLTQVWSRHSVRGPSGPLAVDSLCIYVTGTDRRLTAVDLASGKNRWVVRLSGPGNAGVLRSPTLVYAATDQPGGQVHAIHPTSGGKEWTTGTGYVDVPLRLIDGQLFVMNREGTLLALDPDKGKIQWRTHLGRTRVPPVAADQQNLLVASLDSLFLVERRNGHVTAHVRSPGILVTEWVERDSQVIGVTADSAIIAVDRATLRTEWRLRVDAPVLQSPALRGDTLIVVTRIGSIYRVLLSGEPTLDRIAALDMPVTTEPVFLKNWILVGAADGDIHAIDSTGAEAWKVHVGRPVEVAPFLMNDSTVFGVGAEGQLSRFSI